MHRPTPLTPQASPLSAVASPLTPNPPVPPALMPSTPMVATESSVAYPRTPTTCRYRRRRIQGAIKQTPSNAVDVGSASNTNLLSFLEQKGQARTPLINSNEIMSCIPIVFGKGHDFPSRADVSVTSLRLLRPPRLAGIPSGCDTAFTEIRWCRCAQPWCRCDQPPATCLDAFGLGMLV